MKRTTWAVIIAACVSMAIQASPVDPTRAPRQARYDQTDEYDKYVVENGLKGDVDDDIRDLVELFGGLKTADDVDRNAYGNDRPPYPNRPPLPPRPGNVQNYNQMSERIMNSLYNSFGGPAIRSMIEQYTQSGYSGGGGGGGGGAGYGDEECCKYDAYTIIPGFVLVAVSYLLLLLLNATVTGGRRRREADDAQLNRIDDDGKSTSIIAGGPQALGFSFFGQMVELMNGY